MSFWLFVAYIAVVQICGGWFAMLWALEGRAKPHWFLVASFLAFWPAVTVLALLYGTATGIYSGLRKSLL